jgi:hypothetical protein
MQKLIMLIVLMIFTSYSLFGLTIKFHNEECKGTGFGCIIIYPKGEPKESAPGYSGEIINSNGKLIATFKESIFSVNDLAQLKKSGLVISKAINLSNGVCKDLKLKPGTIISKGNYKVSTNTRNRSITIYLN